MPHTRRPSLSTVALQAGREQEREKDSARRRVAAGRRRMRNVGFGGDTSVHSRRRTRSRSARQTEGIQRGIPPPLPPADAAVVPFCRTAGSSRFFESQPPCVEGRLFLGPRSEEGQGKRREGQEGERELRQDGEPYLQDPEAHAREAWRDEVRTRSNPFPINRFKFRSDASLMRPIMDPTKIASAAPPLESTAALARIPDLIWTHSYHACASPTAERPHPL